VTHAGCYTHSFVSEFRRYTLLLFCFLTGCANIPDSYAPPMQRKPLTGSDPSVVSQFVNMGDPNADMYIVRDITDTVEGNWRWVRKRPELRFFLESVDHLTFKVDFTVPGVVLKETGPVNVSIFVNGKLLDTVHCANDDEKHFAKPVPASYLRANALNFVALETDKVYVAKADGAVLGFILLRAGFTQ
jgi:hypothetical protein